MAIRNELTLRLPNTWGTLAGVCRALSEERVNILALSLEHTGLLRLVVDNHIHAAGILQDRGYKVDRRDVLYTLIPNEPGSLQKVLTILADAEINLDYAYASAIEGEGLTSVVLGVPEADRASAAAGI